MMTRRRLFSVSVVVVGALALALLGPLHDAEVLVEGSDEHGPWTVTASAWLVGGLAIRQAYRDESGVSVVSGYAMAPTLNEASSWGLADDSGTSTLIAGPVAGDARSVVVTTTDGQRLDAEIRRVARTLVFMAVADGYTGIRDITARDGSGGVVDRWTLPPSPPAAPFFSVPEAPSGGPPPPGQ